MAEQCAPTDADAVAAKLALRERQLYAIARISAALYSQVRLDTLLPEIINVSLAVAGADAGSILLYDPKTDDLEFRYVVGEASERLTGEHHSVSTGICGRVFSTGVAEISDDPRSDESHDAEVGQRVSYVTRNMVTVPLKTGEGEVIGVMQILNKHEGLFDEADLEVLSILANQAAMAIEHVELMRRVRVAETVKKIGDISHDIKNMMTPVESGMKTLEMIYHSAFEAYEAVRDEARELDGSAVFCRLDEAFASLSEFFPEITLMVLEGAANVQSRAREIADAVKGQVARPVFQMADLNEVVRSVARTLAVVAERHGITLDTTRLGDLRPSALDPKLMYNAVYNLIHNAIPETPPGGTIAVRTRLEDAPPDGTGPRIVLEVEDTGRGMPEEVRRRLFTDEAISTKPGGTGLGTRIIRNAVDAHDGRVAVRSEQGKGSCFTVHLPFRPTVPHTRPSELDTPQPDAC
ncbi:MAG TPA: GAF domain-containing protein [Armatimonadota bacterium]|nr:GAF domain-containing protein [Armatimonadota bacterium]